MNKQKLTASLVLYNSKPVQFEIAISSFIEAAPGSQLFVMDNSPMPLQSIWFEHPQVVYVQNECNMGFGAAHNRAMLSCLASSELHLILNPDIRLNTNAISFLVGRFEADPGLAAAMPTILYPDGELQRLCKLLPTPLDLLIRRFLPITIVRRRFDRIYEMHDLSQKVASEVPSLSGCFLLAKSSALHEVGGFDERFFMYMEDVDLVRRLASIGKVMYFPNVSVIHDYGKGSYRNPKLLRYHINSAVKYFNKWGWVFDRQRSKRNAVMLSSLQSTGNLDIVAVDADTDTKSELIEG